MADEIANKDQRAEISRDFILAWRYVTSAVFATLSDERRQFLVREAAAQADSWTDEDRARLTARIMSGQLGQWCFREEFVTKLRGEALRQRMQRQDLPPDPGIAEGEPGS